MDVAALPVPGVGEDLPHLAVQTGRVEAVRVHQVTEVNPVRDQKEFPLRSERRGSQVESFKPLRNCVLVFICQLVSTNTTSKRK